MKRIMKWMVFCTVILAVMIFDKSITYADTAVSDGDFTFSIDGDTAILTGYTGSSETVVIPQTVKGITVKRIGNKAFYNNQNIVEVRMPDTILTIMDGEYDNDLMDYVGAFKECRQLKTVKFSDNITDIGKWAFKGCKSLAQPVLPSKLVNINEGAFQACTSLVTFELPATVKSIGQCALYEAGLLEIDLPASVGVLGASALETDTLEAIYVRDGNPHYASDQGVLYSKDYNDLLQYPLGRKNHTYKINKATTTITSFAFSGSVYLSKVILPSGVSLIGTSAFQRSSLEEFELSGKNENFSVLDGVLFSKDGKKLLIYPAGKKDRVYFIPSGVTTVGEQGGIAFDQCSFIEELYIPASVKEFNTIMWYNRSLKKVVFAADSKIGELPAWIFDNCISLESIALPDSIASLSSQNYASTFMDCYKLKSIYIGPASRLYNQTYFSDNMFSGCYELTIYGYGTDNAISKLANRENVRYMDVSNTSDKVLGITFRDTSVNLITGTQYSLGTVVYPATAVNNTVWYESSNPDVVSISADGTVTAVSEGTCVITVRVTDSSGEYARCKINVMDKYSSAISIQGKTVLFTGKPVIVEPAEVEGSTGEVTCSYYSDELCTMKLDGAPTNVGTYYVTAKVEAFGDYSEAVSEVVCLEIVKKSITGFKSVLSFESAAYDGKEKKPSVTIKNGSVKLIKGTDYTVSYKNNKNAGTASVIITGIGNYFGELKSSFVISPKTLKNVKVSKVSDKAYTRKALKPSVIVKDGSRILKEGRDYTLTYKNNVKKGKATITIYGTGNYKGTRSISFQIVSK
jgi:hypothetical protein